MHGTALTNRLEILAISAMNNYGDLCRIKDPLHLDFNLINEHQHQHLHQYLHDEKKSQYTADYEAAYAD
eukprot:jgi/Hompol1/6863/HPOL_003699-RA